MIYNIKKILTLSLNIKLIENLSLYRKSIPPVNLKIKREVSFILYRER
jgi:hypothetical protein